MAREEFNPPPFPRIMHGVNGHISRIECDYLWRAPQAIGSGNYLEIGAGFGRSGLCIADGLRCSGADSHMFSVDIYELQTLEDCPSEQYYNAYSHHDGKPITARIPLTTVRLPRMEYVHRLYKDRDLDGYVTMIKGWSVEVAADFVDTPFVFMFIDGDHRYKGVKGDFNAWSPMLVSGGQIAFHDADEADVQQVIAESNWPIVGNYSSITVIQKP